MSEHGRPVPPAETLTPGQLRSLLHAAHLVASKVELPEVLRHIVVAAKDLVGADYAALGVLGAGGEVAEFVYTGIDAEQVEHIGHPPHGKGILGLLITESRPLRLADLTTHPAATGFPPGHPPMRSFLGVPILIRGKAFGNLYLADKAAGQEFTTEDEELVVSLAAFAAVAIDNARLYHEARHREAWQHASVEITAALLAGTDTDEVLHLIADRARTVSNADLAAVILPTGSALEVRAAAGQDIHLLLGRSAPTADSLCGLAMTSGEPLLSDNLAKDETGWAADLGAGMIVPLAALEQPPAGVLLVATTPGRRGFDHRDLTMLASFGSQAALAQRLADHRAQAEELQLLEERDRIALDLREHVIQELFATGLGLHSVAATGTADQRRRLMHAVHRLDQVVCDIRATIFDLRSPPATDPTPGLRQRLTQVIHEATDPLGFTPALRLDGPLDTLPVDTIAADVLAVVREALSNTARHAGASSVSVEVTATPTGLTVRIEDDGRGIGETTHRSGLFNLRSRAEKRRGCFTVDTAPGQGTTLTWTVPLTS